MGAVRIGFVGCGFAAEHRHLPTLMRSSELGVEAVCDLDEDGAHARGSRFGIARRYAVARELAEDPAVEAVAVCVPTGAHAEVAIAAMERGQARVRREAAGALAGRRRRPDRAPSGSGLQAVVGFNLRSHRVARAARELLRSGAIGSVGSIASAFDDARFSMPDLPAWRMRREHGGGALIDKAIHHLDLWRFLLDDGSTRCSRSAMPAAATTRRWP